MGAAALPIVIGVGMAGQIGASLVSSQQQKETADENLDFQKEHFEYEKDMQQKIMDREDTAIQRQRNDSLAAGISPLANMSGAESSGAAGIAVNAPQRQNTVPPLSQLLAGLGTVASMVDLVSQVENRNAQTNFIQSQTTGRDQANAFDWATIEDRVKSVQLSNMLSSEDLSSKQLQGKFDTESYQDRLNSLKLSNMISKQNYDFDSQSFRDRLASIRIGNSVLGEDLSAKQLANNFSRQTLADRVATTQYENQILKFQLDNAEREMQYKQSLGLYDSQPKNLQEGVTRGVMSMSKSLMDLIGKGLSSYMNLLRKGDEKLGTLFGGRL